MILDSDPDPYCQCGSGFWRAKINARIRMRKLVLPWFGNWYYHGLETGIAMVCKLVLRWFDNWYCHGLEVDPTQLDRDETLTLQMTHKTFDTFASDWTQCTNVAFDKLLKKFQLQNAGHKVVSCQGTFI